MASREKTKQAAGPAAVLLPADGKKKSIPIWLARNAAWVREAPLTPAQKAWVEAQGFKGAPRKHLLLPGPDGSLAGAVLGLGEARAGDPMDRAELAIGHLAGVLPPGRYHLADEVADGELAAVAWGLGAYRFRRYKSGEGEEAAQLSAAARRRSCPRAVGGGGGLARPRPHQHAGERPGPRGAGGCRARARQEARGPRVEHRRRRPHRQELSDDPRGRPRQRPAAPADRSHLEWHGDGAGGRTDARRVTLVGKGICFDTGGLDIKPASGMLIMKKDMGGAASALALGHMIMAAGLDLRLRILIPAADNSIAGNAFRPGDVLSSRAGKTVEIGNTDAEGRLVLADALALADEERPDTIASFATLTGAARVALGPDLPPLYTDDDGLAAELLAAGNRVGDPMWRMPLWPGYEASLDSNVADMNNVSESPFAGSVTAALFLRRFVRQAKRFVHLDIYGWRQAPKPLGPKGGEPNAARALFELLRVAHAPR